MRRAENTLTDFLVGSCESEVMIRPSADDDRFDQAREAPRRAVTQLLASVRAGRGDAAQELLEVIYSELKQLARGRLAREHKNRSLVATELVHECYLRLFDSSQTVEWQNRAHFFGAAAEAMRRILVDRARSAKRVKRGGDRERVELHNADRVADAEPEAQNEELIALDQALSQLESEDERMARVVKLRYFAGLTTAQVAEALELTERTVHRDWAAAKTWLHRRLSGRFPEVDPLGSESP